MHQVTPSMQYSFDPSPSTMEADLGLFLQLIAWPFLYATSCPPFPSLSPFQHPHLCWPKAAENWKPAPLHLPMGVQDSRPLFRMTASINLTEVITQHPPQGSWAGFLPPPQLQHSSSLLHSAGRGRERFGLNCLWQVRTSVPPGAQADGSLEGGSIS